MTQHTADFKRYSTKYFLLATN
ncbi:MAG: hypothetical protein ACPG4Z_03220, partial [Chitinophagales bacterium]